jgi:peptide/nickel transport system substrate-binding protein
MIVGTRARAVWRLLALLFAIAMIAAACGDDDDDDDDGGGSDTTASTEGSTDTGATDETTAPTEGPAETTPATEEDAGAPVEGGEATILLFSEIGTLDPVRLTGSGGSDAQRAFPLYGALATYDGATNETTPLLLESIEPNDDFTVWTLTLPDGLVFSDGTPFDAEAIKFNWTRCTDPANRSPAFTAMLNVASMEVTDPLTLVVTMNTPNAQFSNSVSRIGALNSIGSPTFIQGASEEDLTNSAVGAGPYTLVEWVRDDHMTLAANPDWTTTEGPYLETITLRPVGDEDQRVETFLQGDADLMYTATPSSVERATGEEGIAYESVLVNSGQTILFNLEQAPMDDIRVRQAIALAIDRQALADVAIEGILVADNISADDSPWHTDEADLPAYDPDAAQALFDEYTAENGPIEILIGGFQQVQNQVVTEFVQSSLNQFDGVNVEINIADSPTSIGRVIAGDFQMHTWGFPWIDPDPGLYNGFKPGAITNYSRWANPEVDAAIEAARQTTDFDERYAQYEIAQRLFAEDLPYLPYSHPSNGFLYHDNVHDASLYEDGILRMDLLWLDA